MKSLRIPKKWISVAEVSVAIVVIWVLCAAVVPILMRIFTYKRNTARIVDIKHISTQIKNYNAKSWYYPDTLRDIELEWWGKVPKDPTNKAYCLGANGYETGDYQYYICKECVAVGPYQNHDMKYIVQVGALMEWENKRWERNSGNRWTPYGEGEKSDCAANAIWSVWTILEWMKWNWVDGTGANSIQTNVSQVKYEPRYNEIIASEVEEEVLDQ